MCMIGTTLWWAGPFALAFPGVSRRDARALLTGLSAGAWRVFCEKLDA